MEQDKAQEKENDPLAYIDRRCLGLSNRIDEEIQVRKKQFKEFAKVKESLSQKIADVKKKNTEKTSSKFTELETKVDKEIQVRENQFREFTKNRKSLGERIGKLESAYKKELLGLRNQLKVERKQRENLELRMNQLESLILQRLSKDVSVSTISRNNIVKGVVSSQSSLKQNSSNNSLQDLTTSEVFKSSTSLEEYMDKMSSSSHSVEHSSVSVCSKSSQDVLSDDGNGTDSSLLQATDNLSIKDELKPQQKKKKTRGKKKSKKNGTSEKKTEDVVEIKNKAQSKAETSDKVQNGKKKNTAQVSKGEVMSIDNCLQSGSYGEPCSYLESAHRYLSNLQLNKSGETSESTLKGVAVLLNGIGHPPAVDVNDRVLQTSMEWPIRKRNTTVTEIIYHSGTFYTSKPGYRVQLRAQIDRLHGDVYFSVRILKGLFDENLTWPFPLKFCIKLSPKMKVIEPDDWIIPSAPFWMKQMNKPLTKSDDIFSEWCGPFNISNFLESKKLIFEFSLSVA